MVEVKNLTKSYSGHLAIDSLNFTVEDGEILGFLGPNGAGKSTTMNIMTGYISSTEGTVTIDGSEIFDNPIETKAKIGYLPEIPPLYPDMTVREYLSFVFDLKKISLPKDEHIDEVCKMVAIVDVYDRLIKNLSKGYKQRIGLAQALLGYPKLLILDEPTVGLDPQQIIEIRNLIKTLGQKHTVILSSHVLTEVQAVCDRIIVINKGKLIANDTPEKLRQLSGTKMHFLLTVDGDKDKVLSVLRGIIEISNIQLQESKEDGSKDFCFDSDVDIRRSVATKLSENGLIMLGLQESDPSLEDVFCDLVENALPSDNTVECDVEPENDTDSKMQDENNEKEIKDENNNENNNKNDEESEGDK